MSDVRNIKKGWEIPTKTYSDEPYVVQTDDNAWLCAITTGSGREGQAGQHMISLRSTDKGCTWSEPVAIEPPDGPEASWGVLLKAPGGRIYCFYNHNSDNLREVKADADSTFAPEGICRRVDSLGYFVFKYSDDHGRTWSKQRYTIPLREFAIDRENVYGGDIRFFWNTDRPFIHNGIAYVSVHKVGGFGKGFFTRSEGILLKSENLLSERDPEKITWETLPDGDIGLRTPSGGGPIAEEQSFSVLSDGSFYCVYRTIDGYPACTYSRDGGHTWTEPQYKRYADGRLIKNPRARTLAWGCKNRKFLYWFHNHGGRFIAEHPDRRGLNSYCDRNPVWMCGGVEKDTPEGKIIQWSQPEIILYDDDPFIRMSYPDLVEEDGRYFITETQKDSARVHELDLQLVQDLWNQCESAEVTTEGLVLNVPINGQTLPQTIDAPTLPDFCERDMGRPDYGTKYLRHGFSIDLWVRFDTLEAGQVLLDNRTANGQGFCLQTTACQTVEIIMNDGRTESRWDCEPGMIEPGKRHHIAVVVDGGPKIILFIIDGKVNDGGYFRQFGWGRYNPNLRGVNGADTLRIAPILNGTLSELRIYNRYLRTSEVIGNFRAECADAGN